MPGTGRGLVAVIGATTLGAVLAGCGTLAFDSETDKRPSSTPARAGCDELLGRERVDAVMRGMGGGEFEVRSPYVQVSQAAEAVGSVAARWRPGAFISVGAGSEPCVLDPSEHPGRFRVSIHWSPFSIDLLDKKVPDEPYEPVGHGSYVQHSKVDGRVLRLAVPCKVAGTHAEQLKGLPLEVEVGLLGVDDADVRLQGDAAIHAARQMVKHIPCENRPRIPDSLG